MATHLAQNQFITNPSVPQPPTEVSTADSEYRLQNVARPDETAERDPQPISVSDGVLGSSQPSVEMELSATEATAPSETEGAVSVSTASSDNHIHEIFVYARKLMKDDPSLVGFVLDEAAFMADVEEVPLFIREDGYLKRQA